MNAFTLQQPLEIRVLMDNRWQKPPADVAIDWQDNALYMTAQTSAVECLGIRWRTEFAPGARFFGDAWERGYGDLGWSGMIYERVLPWYMAVREGETCSFIGAETGCGALICFLADADGVTLLADTRAGNQGVALGGRSLHICTLHTAFNVPKPSYAFVCENLKALCAHPLMPSAPVYGGNNWYYAYGRSSREQILADSAFIAEMADGLENRPFMVVDDGWQLRADEQVTNGGPWIGNDRFGDMAEVARRMRETGVRPGIWYRPLLTTEEVKPSWIRREEKAGRTLDPSNEEVLEYVRDVTRALAQQGFELLKHDFSTFDFMGDWGFVPHGDRLGNPSPIADSSKTNAEHLLRLYAAIREGAGDAMVLGCNTIGHLTAGLFEIQRTGDDTSGLDWERTRRMGINTLAMRMPQHGAFYACDGDCVGSTQEVPWALNSQWLTLLAHSGTPLFVSADPQKQSDIQRAAIREAFAVASVPHAPARPLDWEDTTCPSLWTFDDGERRFHWADWYAPNTRNIYWR
ncbi:MAG: alpha-galactosidase [Clostridia bacterium]|nr:alpha-galactosidase [Clostridia bacterium]